jgi:hypothetical protein
MNEQIKFPSQDEIRDAVLLVLAFPNPFDGTEDNAYLDDLELGVLRVLRLEDEDLTRTFRDPKTGEGSQPKDRIWSTIGDLESRGYARVSEHTHVSADTVVWLTPEGHAQAQGVLARTEVVDAFVLQRIPPRECQPMKIVEPPKSSSEANGSRVDTAEKRRHG